MPTNNIVDSWLRTLVSYDFSPKELADRLIDLGLEVEGYDDRFVPLQGFVVGEVLERQPHENADRLSVCLVNTGDGEAKTVVCGAPNVAAGQKIVYAPVGTHIPSADFVIEKRKIRGVVSDGMICSAREIGVGDDHDGILVLDPTLEPGSSVADLFGDIIYDVQVTPNRGDCLSHLGIAREIGALNGNPVTLPIPQLQESDIRVDDVLTISIEDPELCPRYMARVVKGVKVAPSPDWLQQRLVKIGVRPINNVVDVASLVMFECGHPLHAFDYAKVEGQTIVVRRATENETLTTLDGKERRLSTEDLLICDIEKGVAVAGVMGGGNSEIDENSTDILIESAWFDPSSIRKTSRKLNLSTDASYRFERGADINILQYALDRAAALIQELAGGELLKGSLDIYPVVHKSSQIELRFEQTERLLGTVVPIERQISILNDLGITVLDTDTGTSALFSVPSWRSDLEQECDLIEEIGRVYGYGNIDEDTTITIDHAPKIDYELRLADALRRFLIDNGCTEVVLPFQTDPDRANRYSDGNGVELLNALGRDTSAMRSSLVPGISRVIALNQRHSRTDLRLFEFGKAFRYSTPDRGDIPGIIEMNELAIAFAGESEPAAWDLKNRTVDLFDLKGLLERLFLSVGLGRPDFKPVTSEAWGFGMTAVSVWIGDLEVARAGEIDRQTREQEDLSGSPVIAVIDIDRVATIRPAMPQYRRLNRFPVVERDLSLQVAMSVSHDEISKAVRGTGNPLLKGCELVDLYQGKGVEEGRKSMTYRLRLGSDGGTLTDEDVDAAVAEILSHVQSDLDVHLRA